MSATPTVSSKLPALVLRMLDPSGWRVGATVSAAVRRERAIVCTRVGIDVELLDDAEVRLPLPLYYALVEEVMAHTGRAHLGLRLGDYIDESDYGVLGFLFTTSPTVGEAFERMMRYQRLISDEHYEIVIAGEHAHLRYRPWGPERLAHEFCVDMYTADLVLGLQMICGQAFALTGVHLRRARPTDIEIDIEPYRQILGCEPCFSAAENDIVFPARLLSLPIAGANPAMAAFFEDQARQMHDRLPPTDDAPSAAARVRDLIVALLPTGTPKLSAVARPLGVSTRTLQRRLKAENTSLNELVDGVRQELAERHLRSGASTSEVAMLLGFSEVSAFHRAFKRWTGLTPRGFVAG